MNNIIENFDSFSKSKSKKEKTKDNMSIKTKEKVNFVFEDDDDEDTEINDIENILSYEYSEEKENNFDIAHTLYHKNTIVDIEQLTYIPFTKIKKVNNIFSFFNKKNKKKEIKQIKYLVLIDENFLYMIKMTLKENNQNNFYKRIGNHYDLYNFINIKIVDDEIIKGYKNVILTFKKKNQLNKYKVKELHMDFFDAAKFFKILQFYLERINVPFNYNNDDLKKIFSNYNRKVNSLINGN